MRIHRESVSEQIFDDMTRKIKSGAIAPGTKLVIANIQREYQVSSTPVRDALSLLASAGFVEFTGNSNSNASVIEMDRAHMQSILELYDELTEMSFRIIMRRGCIDAISERLHEEYKALLALKGGPDKLLIEEFVNFINIPGTMTGNLYYSQMTSSLRGKFVIAFGDYNRIFSAESVFAISEEMIRALDARDYPAFQTARYQIDNCFRSLLDAAQ